MVRRVRPPRPLNDEAHVPQRPADPIRRRLDLPPERLARVVGRWQQPALLESGPGFGEAGRWSVLAAHPRLVFRSSAGGCVISRPGGLTSTFAGPIWGPLADLLAEFRLAD